MMDMRRQSERYVHDQGFHMLKHDLADAIDEILDIAPSAVAEFCDSRLDDDALLDELEEHGPFAPSGRKKLCQYLDIGESTLSGWLKEGRIPRMAKEAYVLLVVLILLQDEVKSLRRAAKDPKIVKMDGKYCVLRFVEDDFGGLFEPLAREITDEATARKLAGSVRRDRLLQEAQQVVRARLEDFEGKLDPDFGGYIEELRTLNENIWRELAAVYSPDKYREYREATRRKDIDVDLDDITSGAGSEGDASPAHDNGPTEASDAPRSSPQTTSNAELAGNPKA